MPGNIFDRFDQKAPPPAPKRGGRNVFDRFDAKPNVSVAGDMARSAWTGIKEGVTALPAIVGDLENAWGQSVDFVFEKAIGAAQDATGSNLGAGYMGKNAPPREPMNYAHINGHLTGQDLNEKRQRLFGADYQPKTVQGKYARTAGAFATNAVVPVPGGTVARVASVAAPAIMSEAAGQLTEGSEWEPAARVAGAVAGGFGAAGVAGPRNAVRAPPTATPRPNALQERVAAFDRAGVRPTLAATSEGAASTAKFVAENPLAGIGARANLRRSLDDTAEASRVAAARYGTSRGPQMTGEAVQEGVRNFVRNDAPAMRPADPAKRSSFSAKADLLYDEAFGPIQIAEAQGVERARAQFEGDTAGARAAVDAENTRRAAAYEQAVQTEQQRAALASGQGGGKVQPREIPQPERATMADVVPQRPTVTPTSTISTLRELQGRVNAERLSGLITDGRIRSLLGAFEQDAHTVRFNDMRELRTWVRSAQRDPTLRQGIPQAGLQRLESALTQDIYSNAERLGGPRALHNLRRADQYYRSGMGRIQKALQPFDDARSGESAYARVIQAAGSTATADLQKLISLKRSLPADEWGDVASTIVDRMGRPGKGAEGALDADAFSVSNFVSNYAALSPRGRDVLFGSLGGGGAQATALKTQLDNLVRVADMQKGVERAANHSRTAVAGQVAALTTGGTAAVLAPASIPATAGILGSMALTGEALTNPAVVRALAGLSVASRRGQAAMEIEIRRLGVMARRNAALVPIYEQAVRATLPSPAEQELVAR